MRFRHIVEYLNYIGFEVAEDRKHPEHTINFFGRHHIGPKRAFVEDKFRRKPTYLGARYSKFSDAAEIKEYAVMGIEVRIISQRASVDVKVLGSKFLCCIDKYNLIDLINMI